MIGHWCNACKNKACGQRRRGSNNPNWKGGRHSDGHGQYVYVTLSPDSSYIPMAIKAKGKNSYMVAEHRLIMAQHIGRLLEKWEVVHHINGIKDDNRLENLELLPKNATHRAYTSMEHHIKMLEQRVTILEAENELLKSQFRPLKI